MKSRIIDTISKYSLLSGNDNIVAAVSGGADSMCLLHFFYTMKKELNIKDLIVAHVNHNLRGEESKRDELFVKKFCQDHEIQFELFNVDVPKISKELKCGTEEAARKVRYYYFEKLAHKFNALVATAHNANDNAETVIYNLTRGSGLRGLCGIPPKRDYIIRPLLEVTREEVENYCSFYGIEYVTDSTNLLDNYTRNKIRHNIIPVLRQINPSVEKSIASNSDMFRSDDDYLTECAQKAVANARVKYGYDVFKLRGLSLSILSRAIIIIVKDTCGFVPSHKCILSVCDIINSGGRFNIKGNIYANSNSAIFRIYEQKEKTGPVFSRLLPLREIKIHQKNIVFDVITKKEFDDITEFNNLLFKNALDYDIINSNTIVRTRKSGDYFTPPKRGWTKSLKKFFVDEKVVSEKRDSLLLIANGNTVIWVEGFGASQDAQPTGKTEKVLCIKIIDEGEG